MADDSELVRRMLVLERRFLRPERARLDEGILAGESGPEVWRRAIVAGCLPSSWTDDPLRRFRATEAQMSRVPELAAETVGRGRARFLTAVPSDRQAARLLAADPRGMIEAEQHAHALVAGLQPFGLEPARRRIAWRIAGCAVERPEAGAPSLGLLREPIARVCTLMQRLTGRLIEPPHPHIRFRLTHELLTWSHRRARALDMKISDEFGELAGRRLGELDDPFEPWLSLIATGYWPRSVTGSTIELAAGFAIPDGPRPDKRGRPDIARRSSPSTLWAERLSNLRLACMRGDAAWVDRARSRVLETHDPGHAPLIHFGVYGGPAVLDVLAAHDPGLDVEAVDDEGRTPLMLAASLPRGGPLRAVAREVDVPIAPSLGPAAIAWLLARGARIGARDLRDWTALHWAAHEWRRTSIEALTRRGAALELPDARGRTPLLVALRDDDSLPLSDRHETVQALLAAGADADARDDQGWTALHYVAGCFRSERTDLARELRRSGAQPSRDRLGRTPSDLAPFDDRKGDPAFDPRTPVAAGPGPWPPRVRAVELEQALTEDPDTAGRAPLDTLAVWADWLQSQGDPRGELLAAELSTRAVGHKRRRERLQELERLRVRLGVIVDHDLRSGGVRIEVRRAQGLIVRARIETPRSLGFDWNLFGLARQATAALLEREPLLADLRLACWAEDSWPRWLDSLSELPVAPQVRRLVLDDLPGQAPRVDLLAHVFPRVRELWLIGRGKLDQLVVEWSRLEILRIRHGDTSEWGRGGSAFEIAIPTLHTLDLGIPIGGRTRQEEVLGFRRLLQGFGSQLRTLRISPVPEEYLAELRDPASLPGLTSLVLEGVRGQALERLTNSLLSDRNPTRFDRLEHFELSVTRTVASQQRMLLDTLRERLPAAKIRVR